MKKIEDLNMTITIKGICLYEKLTKKSFVDFDKDSKTTVLKFLYAILVSHPENEIRYPYEFVEKEIFSNGEVLNYIEKKLEDELAFINQFGNLFETLEKKKRLEHHLKALDSSGLTKDNKVFIYQLVPVLVKDCGLDIDYVLNDMPYTDIELYINHSNEVHQVKLEEERLWTYLSILPHINSKKHRMKGPEDLIKFGWEEEKNVIKNDNKLDKDTNYLKSIGFKAAGPKKKEENK